MSESARLTYLGHAGFRLEFDGKVLFVDPWLKANPMCPDELKEVQKADVILITHGHFDHLDVDLPEIAERTGATIVTSLTVQDYLKTQGVKNLDGGNEGGTTHVAGFEITLTEARHQANITTPNGREYPHDTNGFVVRAPGLPTIYFAGDTGIFSGMELIGKIYEPRVVVLPIGDFYTMGPRQAAWATRLLQAPKVVPMHYQTFPVLTGTLSAFKEELVNDPYEVLGLAPGETACL